LIRISKSAELKGKNGKVPVSNYLSTTPWRRMAEWRYSSTVLDLGTRWRLVVGFKPLPLNLQGKSPPVPTGWAPELVSMLWRGKKSCSCRGPNPYCPVRSPSLYWLGYRGSIVLSNFAYIQAKAIREKYPFVEILRVLIVWFLGHLMTLFQL
jgi:hypothetical protein